jgi:hypothetical protein
MDITLQTEIAQVRTVDTERNYWFIRTYGGRLYDYFRENGFVGIGFNQVPHNYIEEAKPQEINGRQLETMSANDFAAYIRLQKFIENNTEYKNGEATKWANQLISFQHEIKMDDIVIIPSESSNYLSIGVVTSDVKVVDVKGTFVFNDKNEPYPEKRRKIDWLKEIPKEQFRGNLNGMFFSRTALKNVNNFSEVIEGNLSSLYRKDDNIYLAIKIDQDEEINAFEFQRFLESLTYLYKEFCIDNGIEDNEELYIKIKVQSKGGVFLKGIGIAALFSIAGILALSTNTEVIDNLTKIGSTTGLLSLAAIIALSDNSKIKIELGKWGKVEGHSAGLLNSISNFLDKSQKRKIEMMKFTESVKKLKAKPIDDNSTDQTSTEENQK